MSIVGPNGQPVVPIIGQEHPVSKFLREKKCDDAAGCLMGRPMYLIAVPLKEFEDFQKKCFVKHSDRQYPIEWILASQPPIMHPHDGPFITLFTDTPEHFGWKRGAVVVEKAPEPR